MKIVRFKHWFQVVSEVSGGTVAQFTSRLQAEAFIHNGGGNITIMDCNVPFEFYDERRSYTVRRIKIYP